MNAFTLFAIVMLLKTLSIYLCPLCVTLQEISFIINGKNFAFPEDLYAMFPLLGKTALKYVMFDPVYDTVEQAKL